MFIRLFVDSFIRYELSTMLGNSFSYIPRLTGHKVANVTKLVCSYQYSRYKGKPVMRGLPMTISIEPTTACNLRCPECPSGLRSFNRPTGNLKTDFFTRMVDEMQHHLLYLTFYFQGEPYIHPEFLNMVNYASRKGIYTMTSTNGHFLNEETAHQTVDSGLDRLIISIDGTTQEVYQKYRRNGVLEQVLEGTRNMVNCRKKLNKTHPKIIWQFLVVKPNEHQVNEVYRLGQEIGVDQVVMKTAQIYNYKHDHSLIPDNDRYSRYQRINGEYRIKNPLRNQCWRMWKGCVITWDGKVVPCCFDKDAQHVFGDLNKQSMREIWFGKPYQVFRSRILQGRNQIDICTNCTEGSKVFA